MSGKNSVHSLQPPTLKGFVACIVIAASASGPASWISSPLLFQHWVVAGCCSSVAKKFSVLLIPHQGVGPNHLVYLKAKAFVLTSPPNFQVAEHPALGETKPSDATDLIKYGNMKSPFSGPKSVALWLQRGTKELYHMYEVWMLLDLCLHLLSPVIETRFSPLFWFSGF